MKIARKGKKNDTPKIKNEDCPTPVPNSNMSTIASTNCCKQRRHLTWSSSFQRLKFIPRRIW